ncbi:MAG TPA: SDR family oxidoreductase [Methylomirabilota bacterium]|nr:SDR family oxidoreductase [Methylomirabilota bacterium]
MTDQFRDKVAIVTGGASGIGRALCEALSQRGARVLVADIDTERAQHVASAITTTGGRAHAVHLDVSQAEHVNTLVTDTAAEYGRLDYMFNNVGLASRRGEVRDLTLEHWHRVIDVNLLGVLYGTIAAYSLMVRQGFGHIVNTASLAGLVGFPTSIPYGVTKCALVGLSIPLRLEAADLGVKVSVVCPGQVQKHTRHRLGLLGVDRAAQIILRGVAQNHAIIVFPLYARILWRLYRLCPTLLFPVGRKIVRDFRAGRRTS